MSVPVAVGVAASGLLLALSVVSASSAIEAAHRAEGAADAAALAAADAALGWITAGPCEIAREVIHAADAKLDQCDVDLKSGQVDIRVSVQTIFGRKLASARAGPQVA